MPDFMKSPSSESQVFFFSHEDRRTSKRRDIAKVRIIFHNLANAPPLTKSMQRNGRTDTEAAVFKRIF